MKMMEKLTGYMLEKDQTTLYNHKKQIANCRISGSWLSFILILDDCARHHYSLHLDLQGYSRTPQRHDW